MHRNEKHNFLHPWCRKQIVRAVLVHGTCQNRRTVFPLRMPSNCTDVSSNHRTAELIALDTLALHVFSPAYSSLRQHKDAPHTVDVSSVWLTNSCYGGRQVYLKQLPDSCLLWDRLESFSFKLRVTWYFAIFWSRKASGREPHPFVFQLQLRGQRYVSYLPRKRGKFHLDFVRCWLSLSANNQTRVRGKNSSFIFVRKAEIQRGRRSVIWEFTKQGMWVVD